MKRDRAVKSYDEINDGDRGKGVVKRWSLEGGENSDSDILFMMLVSRQDCNFIMIAFVYTEYKEHFIIIIIVWWEFGLQIRPSPKIP